MNISHPEGVLHIACPNIYRLHTAAASLSEAIKTIPIKCAKLKWKHDWFLFYPKILLLSIARIHRAKRFLSTMDHSDRFCPHYDLRDDISYSFEMNEKCIILGSEYWSVLLTVCAKVGSALHSPSFTTLWLSMCWITNANPSRSTIFTLSTAVILEPNQKVV